MQAAQRLYEVARLPRHPAVLRRSHPRPTLHGSRIPLTIKCRNPLHPVEVRVLGALLEKEITTPEYYPLTLNALVNACNQKSNRDPVVNYDEEPSSRPWRCSATKGCRHDQRGGPSRREIRRTRWAKN